MSRFIGLLFLVIHFVNLFFLVCSFYLEGVKIISEALVKSMSFKDDKLEIKLKDGRLVSVVCVWYKFDIN